MSKRPLVISLNRQIYDKPHVHLVIHLESTRLVYRMASRCHRRAISIIIYILWINGRKCHVICLTKKALTLSDAAIARIQIWRRCKKNRSTGPESGVQTNKLYWMNASNLLSAAILNSVRFSWIESTNGCEISDAARCGISCHLRNETVNEV